MCIGLGIGKETEGNKKGKIQFTKINLCVRVIFLGRLIKQQK